MKILYTSDIHASPKHLLSMLSVAKQEDVDAVIIGGDLVPHSLPKKHKRGVLEAQAIYLRDTLVPAIKDFKQKKGVRIYLDLSNDDYIDNRSVLENHSPDLFCLLHMQKHRLTDNIDIIGYMNVPPTPFGRKDWEKPDSNKMPYPPGNKISLKGYISAEGTLKETVLDLSSVDTIENELDQLSEIVDKSFIFVSHTPPYNTPLDVIETGLHVGSLSVRNFIEKWSMEGKIIASLHGHIHESPNRSGLISTRINNVLCINPGQDSGYITRFKYVILKLSDLPLPAKIEIM